MIRWIKNQVIAWAAAILFRVLKWGDAHFGLVIGAPKPGAEDVAEFTMFVRGKHDLVADAFFDGFERLVDRTYADNAATREQERHLLN